MDEPRRPLLTGILEDLKGLAGAPRDLWIVFSAKFVESIAYFAVVNVLVLYLHDDLRFSDELSASTYAGWGAVISLLTFVAGFLADAMGKRKALIVAALVAIVGRALLSVSEVPALPLIGLVLGAWGVASMKPIMVAVVKTYAPTEIRAFSYSMYYVVMNLGAFVAGRLVSGLRIGLLGRSIRPAEVFTEVPIAPRGERDALLEELVQRTAGESTGERAIELARGFARMATGRDFDFWTGADIELIHTAMEARIAGQAIPEPPMGLSGYEMIFLVAALLSVISLVLVRMLTPVGPAPLATDDPAGPRAAGKLPVVEVLQRAVAIGNEVRKEKTFWAFVLFVALLVLVKAVFVHAHSTWPTYLLREFGRDTPQGAIWSYNPLLIIILTPLIGSATSRFSAWWVIIIGSFVTASSLLFMVSHEPSEAVARSLLSGLLGPDAHYEYAGAYAFVVVLSIGEALWSPRLYEYVAMMAPPGREASYMGLAELPYFAAKVPVGIVSGLLIAGYCAENEPCQSEPIWLIVLATTLAGPIIALLFSGFIRAAERARAAENAASRSAADR